MLREGSSNCDSISSVCVDIMTNEDESLKAPDDSEVDGLHTEEEVDGAASLVWPRGSAVLYLLAGVPHVLLIGQVCSVNFQLDAFNWYVIYDFRAQDAAGIKEGIGLVDDREQDGIRIPECSGSSHGLHSSRTSWDR